MERGEWAIHIHTPISMLRSLVAVHRRSLAAAAAGLVAAGVHSPRRAALADGSAAAIVDAVAAPSGLSIKELSKGDGAFAEPGSWLTLHYRVVLVGDGSVVDDTRSSGYGDREYGTPLQFELGDLRDKTVLRALHATALDMRVGGRRRVRTRLLDPSFGYLADALPRVLERRDGRAMYRRLQGDWLIDVEVELLAAAATRPPHVVVAWVTGAVRSLMSG